MPQPVTTAGKAQEASSARDPRKEAIRLIGRTLRKQEATEDEVDAALEALVELTKD